MHRSMISKKKTQTFEFFQRSPAQRVGTSLRPKSAFVPVSATVIGFVLLVAWILSLSVRH